MKTSAEIKNPVNLCDRRGLLNPDAFGWSRKPLHRCNLSGHFLRKKKWNYWCIITDEFAFSITLANIDYIGLAFSYLIDFKHKEMIEKTCITPLGIGCNMPEEVEKDIEFARRDMNFSIKYFDEKIKIEFGCKSMRKKEVIADINVLYPKTHETLNVVVPWSRSRFQFTSKQNAMPAYGTIRAGDKVYECRQNKSFACLDFGRGIWHYKVCWIWASFSGRCNENLIGLNLGGKWTDGTGINENGICFNGKLYKIDEDVIFNYNNKNFMQEWEIKTKESDIVDLRFVPFFERYSSINLIFLKTCVHQMFGFFSGRIAAGEEKIEIDHIPGWAEEHKGLW